MPTAIGDVVPALVAVIDAALPTTTVYHGPQPTSESPTEFVCVAFDPDGTGDGVVSDQQTSPMGNLWLSEAGDVTCAVFCWSGSTNVTDALLARADDLLDLIDAALMADRFLGGVLVEGSGDDIQGCRVFGRTAWSPTSTERGSVGRLTFTVRYSSLLTA